MLLHVILIHQRWTLHAIVIIYWRVIAHSLILLLVTVHIQIRSIHHLLLLLFLEYLLLLGWRICTYYEKLLILLKRRRVMLNLRVLLRHYALYVIFKVNWVFEGGIVIGWVKKLGVHSDYRRIGVHVMRLLTNDLSLGGTPLVIKLIRRVLFLLMMLNPKRLLSIHVALFTLTNVIRVSFYQSWMRFFILLFPNILTLAHLLLELHWFKLKSLILYFNSRRHHDWILLGVLWLLW